MNNRDIIQTVALEPTSTNIGVLAMIVLVRTFLGWTLAMELERRWPCRERKTRVRLRLWCVLPGFPHRQPHNKARKRSATVLGS
ncbi:DUF1622 domain-containing protein [Gammaproteobacteria bacterium]|nr:DUF1622 domain-containing protein [Gammaproteobacteria bacterium]